MDPLLITAASGMKARMESLDMLANNIANSATAGFKSDREFYGLYQSQLPVIERQWTDYSQGTLIQTGNPLDLALNGQGMFALNGPNGIVYTRAGNFQISRNNQLANAGGYTLRDVRNNGNPINVDPAQPVEISKTGVVSQGGQELGQIEIDAPDAQALAKMGSTNFSLTDKSSAIPAAAGTEILQGQIEQSNVPVSESAVKLVGIMRQFEMLQRAITLDTDMTKRAIDEVAKVS
ncbi:MAG TPA: flagellar hook basal-body protein [Bryobacteraceae bacterium]|jgi:flagellar basal-body rod protein FlgF|nr:flagellar hook basal-body protein [Bryobacteraceae bacterium]